MEFAELLTIFGSIASMIGLLISVYQVFKYRKRRQKLTIIVIIVSILFLSNTFFFVYIHFKASGIFPSGYEIKLDSIKIEEPYQYINNISQSEMEIKSNGGKPIEMTIEGKIIGAKVYKLEERRAFAYTVVTRLDKINSKWEVYLKGKCNISKFGQFRTIAVLGGSKDNNKKEIEKLRHNQRYLIVIFLSDYKPKNTYDDLYDLVKFGRPVSSIYRFIVKTRLKIYLKKV